MNIKIVSVDEETGRVELELDEEARAWLIEVGFNKILRDTIDEKSDVSDDITD